MGLYFEADDKKLWLEKNGMFMGKSTYQVVFDYDAMADDETVVCLVDNGAFFAGAVAFSKKEFEYFSKPDGRLKYWYLVRKDILKPMCPMWDNYMKDN